jgi:cytochrome c biogenesis protein CcmG, thiol:disulfide interchange protein DsbE
VSGRRLLVASVVLALAGLAGIFAAGLMLADGNGATTGSNPTSGTIEVAVRAPVIAGRDLTTGETVSLERVGSKPVVLTAWASWCAPCARGAPVLAAFARRHRGDALVVGLDLQDERPDARAFHERFGWTFRSISDPDGALAAELGLGELPTTLFLGRGRLVVARVEGVPTRPELEAGLAEAAG